MSNSKTHNLSIERLAQMFKALSNPKRLEIFMSFVTCIPPGTVSESTEEQAAVCQRSLSEEMGLAPSTVSHHVKELCTAGLINKVREGKNVLTSVNPDALEALALFIKRFDNR